MIVTLCANAHNNALQIVHIIITGAKEASLGIEQKRWWRNVN